MKYLRCIASYVCYWIGDLISKAMVLADWAILNAPYQKIMLASDWLQHKGEPGPWQEMGEECRCSKTPNQERQDDE